ncbi:uncharacterized protein LOC126697398 isoform X1 [Quercus robur]|uniref:uncharacterized protein LOC126697398 isoform X1 n=1 Tax=Quercus robur TaxID=38942 RepID=UPI002161AEAE|nr:uncharacterized protein LOC126697398 isoform X1 [Quercus robur]
MPYHLSDNLRTKSMEETNVSLRLLINTESQRVLFAEADKSFIDFLFHILSLPVGTFITILTKQGMVGSLGNIYESIENINITCLQPNLNKETLLKSKVHISGGGTGVTLLLPKVKSPSTSRYWYRCSRNYSCYSYVSNDSSAKCPSCLRSMNDDVNFVDPPRATNVGSSSSEEGYVKGVVTYMVMDDLVVKPMSTISCVTLLNRFNVKDVGVLEEKVVDLGIDEGVKLLKASLQSKTVLTDVLLPLLKPEGKLESERQTTMGGNGADAVAAPAAGGAPAAVAANSKNEENVEDTGDEE